jgi:O-antigen/teichoic acid export membrane protein
LNPYTAHNRLFTFMTFLSETTAKLFAWIKGQPDDEKRIAKAKKHIKVSFIVKGLGILISFLLVPLTIGYVDKTIYGIWMTLFSVVSWFRFFDIGLDNGLRNKFAEALAKNAPQQASMYLSTTYAILGLIAVVLIAGYFAIEPLLDWVAILNVPPSYVEDVRRAAKVTWVFFCLNFVFKLINTVVIADQRPAIVGAINLISSILILVVVFLLTQYTEGSLLRLAWVLSGIPLLVLMGATLWFYLGKYREMRPKITLVDFGHTKDLVSLGSQFFVIQIIGIVLFTTDNLIISHLYSPQAVTPYAITHKYFGIITRIFGIVAIPFWSAYTDAYTQGDWAWIKRTNKGLKKVWRNMALGSLMMLIASPLVYKIWVPEVEGNIYWLLSVLMWAYVLILSYGSIYVMFVNGIGKVRLQVVSSLIGGVLNIPLSIFFASTLGLGTAGIILATIVCMLYGAVLGPIQFDKIINGRATGIWNK